MTDFVVKEAGHDERGYCKESLFVDGEHVMTALRADVQARVAKQILFDDTYIEEGMSQPYSGVDYLHWNGHGLFDPLELALLLGE